MILAAKQVVMRNRNAADWDVAVHLVNMAHVDLYNPLHNLRNVSNRVLQDFGPHRFGALNMLQDLQR